MVKKIKAYFETLEGLSTEALAQSAEKLVRAERSSRCLESLEEHGRDFLAGGGYFTR